jgi:hypothetical protein
MTHIFKVQFQFADLMVYAINLEDKMIKCMTVEKDTGRALSTLSSDKFTVHKETIHFPLGNMTLSLAKYIEEILK